MRFCPLFLCVFLAVGVLAPVLVSAKQLTIDTSQPCGGMPVVDSNPVELLPLLGEGSGWTLDWKSTCLDMGGQKMMGTVIPRAKVLAARYVNGQNAVAVTLSINQDAAQRPGSSLDMGPEAAQYSMVKPLESKTITVSGKDARTGVLGGMGDYRQDVLDVMLSPNAILSLQHEYSSSGQAMDMVKWAEDVLKVEAYADPAWVKGK
ncbi:MAG: hypothetical protein EOL86_15340 [Deltaproteobacteria bacterium]|nr:hypothetical protein [Deltaproteobacteria bacterium]